MSYGIDAKQACERAADLFSRVLAGAQPPDILFEQPTRCTFLIDVAHAKLIGSRCPTLLALTDERIDLFPQSTRFRRPCFRHLCARVRIK